MNSAQPATAEKQMKFEWTAENKKLAEYHVAKYPKGRQQSAVMPLLDIAQRQSGGWLPKEAMDYVANYLGMPLIRVYEVASFYTMYNLNPVGKNLVQVCTTTPCWLRGSDEIVGACKKKLGIGMGETTADGKFTLVEVECLGACVNAPVVQINDDFYEDLDSASIGKVLDDLSAGRKPNIGTQIGRQNSAPIGGGKTLVEVKK